MAPWTHTYLSPQHERRLCCASREPAQNFKQYLDTGGGDGSYSPLTLEQHWNSDHIRSVRRRMMANEELPECVVCNNKILNTSVYKNYFNQLFGHKYQQVIDATAPDGFTSVTPVSWDYRFTNLCNFKCRMCGHMLSSAWETEIRTHDSKLDLTLPENAWMRPDIKKQIEQFTDQVVVKEFLTAVENKTIEEIYWVGGEPLMWDIHWTAMKRIVELGYANKVYPRYNTNLSRVDFQGDNLFQILKNYKDWQICASIDGTGAIGEYIRTGLKYDEWLENFKQGMTIQTNPRQMRLDVTLTLPGLFDIDNLIKLSTELNVMMLTKVCYAFDAKLIMSPLCLPRPLLEKTIERILKSNKLKVNLHGQLIDVLLNMKSRKTFEEEWPDTVHNDLKRGKYRIQRLESIRPCSTDLRTILSADPEILQWWDNI